MRIDILKKTYKKARAKKHSGIISFRERQREEQNVQSLTRLQLPHPILSLYETKQNKLVRQTFNR